MIKWINLALFLILSEYTQSQSSVNIVNNYSFELDQNGNYVNSTNCAVGPNNDGNCPTVGSSLYPGGPDAQFTDMLNFWNQIYGWTCPDRKTICDISNYVGVGSADIPCNAGARTGLRFESGTISEHALSELLYGGMISGHFYYWEYYVKAAPDEPNVGIRLFEDKPKQCGYQKISDNDPPQLKAPDNYLSTIEWKKVSGFINADKNYKWIGLGRFGYDNSDQGGTTTFDDIKIYDLGTEQCPSTWLFENTVFENENRIYQASDKIIAGENVDAGSFNGPVVVKANSNVIFKAGNQIILEPGFSTEAGSYFETVIEPCSPNICPFIPPALNDVLICDANPIEIGNAGAETGLYYSWSPATYLDNPNSPNPTFTPPTGSGNITYTVTITSVCGYFFDFGFPPNFMPFITETVNVNYNTNPNFNPIVNITNFQTSEYDFSFDFAIAPEAEEYCISILNMSYNTLVYSDCFDVNANDCCTYSISNDDLPYDGIFSHCHDYKITVSSKNYCSGVIASDEVIWDRTATPITVDQYANVATIPDAPNECFNITGVTGADGCHVLVFNQYGDELIDRIIDVTSSEVCLWDGYFCDFPFGCDYAVPGVYYFIVELTSNCATSLTETYFGTLFWDADFNGMIVSDSDEFISPNQNGFDSSNTNESLQTPEIIMENEIQIFPNPAKDYFHLNYSDKIETDNFKLEIMDNTGRLIFITNDKLRTIDCNEYSNGIYFLNISTNQGIFREKIIKQ